MEIHELNTFSGTLGSGDYFATDNGTDTSKISASDMFGPLEERIDNIIAGPASSAQEVIDARLGANGVTYSSLGDAIREQITEAESNIDTILNDIIDFSAINDYSLGNVNFVVDKEARTITATGTATRNVVWRIKQNITGYSKILLKGGPIGGSSGTFTLAIYDSNSGTRVSCDNGSLSGTLVSLDPAKTYFIAVVVINGNTVNNTIYAPKAITGGMLFDIAETISGGAIPKYRHFSGVAFICECGTHIYIDAEGFRLHDTTNKIYTSAINGTTKLNGGSESVRYVNFDGENFTVSPSFSENAIAYIYMQETYPLIDGIVPTYRKIQDGYIRENSEFYINFDRTPIDALGVYFDPDIKISRRGYIYKRPQKVIYNIRNLPISFVLSENTTSISNKKILMIGDSFVARGYIQKFLSDRVPTLTFIGTKTTQNYGFQSEGVSGSRLYYFTDPATSPFYFNGGLDFAQYLATNSLSAPDYVVINSAINHNAYNDTTYGTYLSQVLALVNMIKSYNASIKIYVTFGANYAIEPGSTYNYPNRRYTEVRKCCNSVYDVEGITVIPIDFALIDELDYNSETVDYLGTNVTVLADCVHPSENVGFKKIANMIYNYLGV